MRFAIGFLSGSIITLFAAGMFIVGAVLGDEYAEKNTSAEQKENTIEE